MSVIHWVYYLHDARTGRLLYIGRTMHLRQRKRAFEKRTGRSVSFGRRRFFDSLEVASTAEREAITALQPPYNQWVISSPGTIGHKGMGQGRKLSPEHRANIAKGNTGKTTPKGVREAIRLSLLGHPVSDDTRRKISERALQRSALRHQHKTHDFGGFAGGVTIRKTRKGTIVEKGINQA